jgi:N-acetylmuramoyl-L-alanine amidase
MRKTSYHLGIVLIIVLVFWSGPSLAREESSRDLYFRAEGAYKNLINAPSRQKLRHYWLRVIEKFEAVYKRDPDGEWASASLYRAGVIWLELSRFSGRQADREIGVERLQNVVTQFPRSAYRTKARTKLRELGAAVPKTRIQPHPESRRHFAAAERCRRQLSKNPRRTKHRDVWLECIDRYEMAYKAHPDSETAAQCLLQTGLLYLELSRYSRSADDRENGKRFLSRVVRDYPQSPASALARKHMSTKAVPGKTVAQKMDSKHSTIDAQKSASSAGASSANRTVSELRFWSNPNYTRVVIDTDGKLPYFHRLLNKDPDLKKPQRLYVDLRNARLGKEFPRVVPINDNLLIDARAGQYTNDTVRVVMDIKSFEKYKIFSLMNPFRIVIDIWGHSKGKPSTRKAAVAAVPQAPGKIPPGSLTRSLALGVSRIVIDAGHGGKDPGARGYYRRALEKDITLSIAKKLAKKIKSRLGCDVILTRQNDKFLTLEERTAMANTENADLFISIHVNAHRNKHAYGTETYFLNLATDEESIRVAAMENATSEKNISDLQTILMDLMQNAKINESSRLAGYVQGHMVQHLSKKYRNIKDKGVKQAPFYVLLGAQMPAILIETAFISNARECKRLMDPNFQNRLCDGIVQGIEKYIQETSPTAYRPVRTLPPRNG